ncbi:hypothetical protein ACWM0G_02000 [Weissella cibaria]
MKTISKITWHKSLGLMLSDTSIVDNAPYLTFEDGTTDLLTNERASEIPGISKYSITSNRDDFFIVEENNWIKVEELIKKFASEK